MKKVFGVMMAALCSCSLLNAVEFKEFDGIDIVEDSELLVGKAGINPRDEALYEDVMSQLSDLNACIYAQGDYDTYNSINNWLMMNKQYFSNIQLMRLQRKLEGMDASQIELLSTLKLKDPASALVLSILLGGFGIDRIYIGQTFLGVLKLVTVGGFGIWYFIDWFFIMGATRNANYRAVEQSLRLLR